MLAAKFNQLLNVVLLFLLLVSSCLVKAEVDFLVFPEVKIQHTNGSSFTEKNITPSVALFAAGSFGAVNVLVEGYAAEKVQHLERLQLGINVTESTRIWFGRHHNPYGYWHTQYHHGTFLQTSISRPSIADLGGAGGIIPSHSTGVLFEGELEQQTSAWHYSASIGYTSQFMPAGGGHHGGDSTASLGDLDILNPKIKEHKLGYTVRLTYLPDALAEIKLGGFINHGNIMLNTSQSELSESVHDEHEEEHGHEPSTKHETITLDVFGIFANYQHQALRLISEAYYVSSKVPTETLVKKNSFSAAYLQLEYALDNNWTPYIRVDKSFSYRNDDYLDLLNGYPVSANTAGIRLDLPSNNAIKLEYSKRDFNHQKTAQWLVNWSAAW